MKCEFYYCIYNQDFLCKLSEEVQINSLGMCEYSIIASIPDDVLKEAKQKQLKDIEDRHDKFQKDSLSIPPPRKDFKTFSGGY